MFSRKTSTRLFVKYGRQQIRFKHNDSGDKLIQKDAGIPIDVRHSKISPAPIHRVTYEYPPPPKPKKEIPKESTTWRRHVPSFAGVAGLLWAGYAVYYLFGNNSSAEQTVLTPDKFTTYRITNKQPVSADTESIELSPKFAASQSMSKSGATSWNGKRLWSIQVKHPMIQIARNYTPSPIYFMQSDRQGEPPLMRIMGTAEDEGRMTLLVKRYADGEMSRYLHSLPVGSDVEIRGPFIEHRFPYGPADQQKMRQPMLDNPSRMSPEPELDPKSGVKSETIAMFTAGTGITTAMQLLLNPYNPPRGFVEVYHSARTKDDIPFERFRLFLESVGRARFHLFVDNEHRFITLKDIPSFAASKTSLPAALPAAADADTLTNVQPKEKYLSVLQQYTANKKKLEFPAPTQSVVCGPPGYITYVSGNPGIDGQSEIGGSLGAKGWERKNTKRLVDI